MNSRVSSFLLATLLAVFVVALCLRSYATANGVPLLGVDARVFLPPALSFYQSGELTNHVWTGAIKLDPTGQGRMIYHGFLFPMLVAKLMWRGDYLALAGSLALLQALATTLLGVLLLAFAKRWKWELSNRRLLVILFLTAAGANYTQGSLGRPDSLAAIFVTIAMLLGAAAPYHWHKVIAGVAIGLLAAVAPAVSILSALTFAGFAAWRNSGWRCIWEVTAAAAISVAVFGCCILWYPYPFADWWAGTLRMGESALAQGVDRSSWRPFLYDYFARGSSWFLGAFILLIIWSAIRIVRRAYQNRSGPVSPVLFYGTLVLAAVAFGRLVFYVSWARYNLLPLMPLGFLAVFHELARADETENRFPYRPVAMATLAAMTLGFAGDLLERAHLLRHGPTLPDARARFTSLKARYPDARIGLHQNLFTLTEERVAFGIGGTPPPDATLWLLPQAYQGSLQPPEVASFRLIEKHFNPRPLTFLGRPLWTGDRSCGFAVYLREPDAISPAAR